MNPVYLCVRDLRKVYSSRQGSVDALGRISLDIAPGTFISIVGPSGCGKSTLLQIIAGLLPESDGEVGINGTAVVGPPSEVIYVFQQYTKSVYPWKTVLGNVKFGITNRRTNGVRPDKAEVERRCREMLELVGLARFADYYPYQLSGGMQQRVALTRALVCRPAVLLMDEPFSSVDALTRTELQDGLLRLWGEIKPTVVFVTHDIDEAIYLSQEVVVLTRAPARVSQVVAIKLSYPRDQIATREHPAYLEYRKRILADVRGERYVPQQAIL